MYESPKDFIDDWIPQGRIPFDPLARLAGALYLLSLVVPFLSDRLAYAVYTSPAGRDNVWLNLPVDLDIFLLVGEGTLVGPLLTAGGAENAAGGVVLGLIDLLLAPLLIVALPIMGVVMVLIPLLLGVLLLRGYDKHLVAMSWGYMLPMTMYAMMLGIKSIGFQPHLGALMCMVAAMILFALAIDRYNEVGVVSGNGYALSKTKREH